MGLGTCGNRDMWGRDMCPHPNSVGTNGIGTYGVGTYGVGTSGIGTYVLEPCRDGGLAPGGFETSPATCRCCNKKLGQRVVESLTSVFSPSTLTSRS